MFRKTGAVFTLDKEDKTLACAQALAKPFNAARVLPFKASSFAELSDIDTLVTLGHTEGKKYGKMKAAEFAKEFSKSFEKAKKNKSELKHLCMIGCEVGLTREDGSSIAQDVANELHNRGFTQLQLHAVGKPIGREGEAMYVEVKHDQRYSATLGFIEAYLMPEKDAKALDKVGDNSKDHLYKKADRRFLETANPTRVLSEAANTFIANETLVQRHKRVTDAQKPVPVQTVSAPKVDKVSDLFYIVRNAEIQKRIDQLEKEIKAIKPACLFPFFAKYERETKQRKVAALTKIKNANTPTEWAMALDEALHDSRVMRSAKTSFTKDLLNTLDEKLGEHKVKMR